MRSVALQKMSTTMASSVDVPHCPCCGYKLFEENQSLVHAGLRFVIQDFYVFVYRDDGSGRDQVVERLPFTRCEAVMLMTLAMFKGRVVSKQVLYDALYPQEQAEPKIIDVFVCKIRRKLANLNLPLQVLTDWGRGYALAEIKSAQAA